MPTNYNGDGTIPSSASFSAKNISSSTNANPIVVTTSTAHGYGNGDTVFIEGHLVNTNANGLHTITVQSANTFSLNGVAGNGVGANTGLCVNYSVRPLVQVISDGDILNASNLNPAPEANTNAIPYLYGRAGQYRIWDVGTTTGGTQFSILSTTSCNVSTYTSLTSLTDIIGTATGQRYLINGDRLRMKFTGALDSSASPSGAALAFGINLAGGGDQVILGSSTMNDMGVGTIMPVALDYEYVYAGSTTGVTYSVSIMGITGGGTHNLVMWGTYALSIMHLRSNA